VRAISAVSRPVSPEKFVALVDKLIAELPPVTTLQIQDFWKMALAAQVPTAAN
jgi:hypothetical protein